MSKISAAIVLLSACVLSGCTEERVVVGEPNGEPVLEMVAINSPLADFARHLGGDAVSVTMPVPAGEDPAFWIPGVEDILAMQRADLVLLNGAGYEPWLSSVSLTSGTVIDTSASLAEAIIYTDSVTHQHGPDGDHSHGASAFTIWLDPTLALEQARAIKDAIQSRREDLRTEIDNRFSRLETELRSLHQQWQSAADYLAGAPVLFSHPVYQYVERRYDLNGRSLHWEPDQFPDEAQWQMLDRLLTTHPATVMIWESEPGSDTSRRLSNMGIRAVVLEPGANLTADKQYLDVQRSGLEAILDRTE